MSSAGQLEGMRLLIQGLNDANAVRYFTLIGVVVLLYDHTLTFKEEVRCIWKAPNSFPKFAFLLNRYLVPCGLIAVLHEMCGFSGAVYGAKGCRALLSAACMISVLSIYLGNTLVLLRVIILWSESKIMRYALYATYAISSVVTLSMMILTVIALGPGVRWSSATKMCISTTTTQYLIGTWGAPMLFEIHTIIATAYNTVSMPRSADVPLIKALQRDGMTFFAIVSLLRLFNVILAASAATSRASLTMLGSFFVWAAVTLVLNRSLLRLRRAEIAELRRAQLPFRVHRIATPFGLLGDDNDGEEDQMSAPPFQQACRLSLRLHSPMGQPKVGLNIQKATQSGETWDIDW